MFFGNIAKKDGEKTAKLAMVYLAEIWYPNEVGVNYYFVLKRFY